MTATQPRTETDITVRNPATGQVSGSVPIHDADTVAKRAEELRAAQPEWEAMGPRGRKRWLLEFQNWLLDNADHLTEVLMSETGKSRNDASLEPVATGDNVNFWATHAEEYLSDGHPKAHSPLYRVKRFTTVYRPQPLVGVITPWNFPLAMPGMDVPPALAAGAAVLLKPSEVTRFRRSNSPAGGPRSVRRRCSDWSPATATPAPRSSTTSTTSSSPDRPQRVAGLRWRARSG